MFTRRPFGAQEIIGARNPGAEAPGYFTPSLRDEQNTQPQKTPSGNSAWGRILITLFCLLATTTKLPAADLLPGEFADIQLDRELVHPGRFPTIKELRQAVADPEIAPVLMLKLYSNGTDDHHLPIWSGDGRRLAFQRSDLRGRSSKLLLYRSMSQGEPKMLSDQEDAYDYMFRWGVNAPASFVFVRIAADRSGAQILFSPDGESLVEKVPGRQRHQFPALYRRTDGIWRMVYEQDGRLMHQAWDAQGAIGTTQQLAMATCPRWSSDGTELLFARLRGDHGELAEYEIAVRNLRSETLRPLPGAAAGDVVRSPCWSPDGSHAAFYTRAAGDQERWRIQVAATDGAAAGRTLGYDVLVNRKFESEGPAWQPDGRRLWFFSNEHRTDAYYPMVAADVATGQLTVIDYPRRCTTPNDLAINPATAVPEIAMVAHDGPLQDLFIVFMNHY